MKRAVFLDRDGVINHTVFRRGKPRAPYTLKEFQFFEGVREAIETLRAKGYVLIVVTNQPDVARGWVERKQVDLVNDHVINELQVDELAACFHVESDDCQCRKPRPGMLLEAAKKWNIDLSQSFMVGDRNSDIEAGHRAGCKSIWINTPDSERGSEEPEHECSSLLEAASWICEMVGEG